MVSGYQLKQSKPFPDETVKKYCLTFTNLFQITILAHCAQNGIVVSASYIVCILALIGPQSSGQAWDSSEIVSGYQLKQSKPFPNESVKKYCLTFTNLFQITILAHCAQNGIVVSASYIVCILALIGPQSSGQAWDSSEMVSGYQLKQSKPFPDESVKKYCLTFTNLFQITILAHCAQNG